MAMARGIDEVDAVKAGRIPTACVALARITLIQHIFDLWKGFFDVQLRATFDYRVTSLISEYILLIFIR